MPKAARKSRRYRNRPYRPLAAPEGQDEAAGAAPAPISGCIKETRSNPRHPARAHFEEDFLTCPLFSEIPDAFDICYVIENPNPSDFYQSIHFYLHDTTQPFPGEVVPSAVLASLKLSLSFTDRGWFWQPPVWVPHEAYIAELETNSALRVFNETYNVTGAGLGSFMILCAIAYLKFKGVKEVKLDDASDRTGQVSDNIYRNLDFKRRDTGSDKASQLPSPGDSSLAGNVEQIYEKFVARAGWFSSQSSQKGKRRGDVFSEALRKLDSLLDDTVADPDYEPGSDRSLSKRRKKRRKQRRSKSKQRKAKQSKAKQSKAKRGKRSEKR